MSFKIEPNYKNKTFNVIMPDGGQSPYHDAQSVIKLLDDEKTRAEGEIAKLQSLIKKLDADRAMVEKVVKG